MNKRLTDMDRREWGKSLILLLESEKAGWEEVERLKEKFYTEQERAEKFIDEAFKQTKEVERLQGQLQDALTVISDALTDVMDMLAVSEMEGRDMELCPQCNMLSLHDDLNAAIQRIQEEGKQS